MPEPKLKLQRTFPSVLVIDEARIDVRVKRMTNREFDDFALMFAKLGEQKPGDPAPVGDKADADEATRAWMRDALDAYLSILPGQIDDGGADITQAGALVDLYGGRIDVVPQALALIYGENRVSEKKKDSYRWGLAFSLGLVEAATSDATGSAPAPTADAAEPQSYVPAEDASPAGPLDASSGIAALSC